MDVATEQDEAWINRVCGVPSVPESTRLHYPFSRGSAFVYRLKLAVVTSTAAFAFYWAGDPCQRYSVLLNCWLLFVTCDALFRNYPWREPFHMWLWELYLNVPYSRILFSVSAALLLLVLLNLGTGCVLVHPFAASAVAWLCLMLRWPRVRERWHRPQRSELDYDQFSCNRPLVLMLPDSCRVVCAALQSPSMLALLTTFLLTSTVALFLNGWTSTLWLLCTGSLCLGCFAILCCHRLPLDVARTKAAWEKAEDTYSRHIEHHMRIVGSQLRSFGPPEADTNRFDRLAVQVPLLLREVEILRSTCEAMSSTRAEELDRLASVREVTQFCWKLDDYGPYTTECCVS